MKTVTPCEMIESRGSLELHHESGDERNPESYWIRFGDGFQHEGKYGSLQVADEWFEIDGIRLNGSQAQTVKLWAEQYI